MRAITVLIATLIFISLAASLSPQEHPPAFLATIEQMKHSLTPIVCGRMLADGKFQRDAVVGTAFFVGTKGHILTAGHVIDKMDEVVAQRTNRYAALLVPASGWDHKADVLDGQLFSIDQCRRDRDLDLAVCKPAENPFERAETKDYVRAARLELEPVADGTRVAFIGFPLDLMTPTTSVGFVASYIPVLGVPHPAEVLVDRGFWTGASGGPLFLDDGRVIGMVLGARRDAALGLTRARPAALIAKFLKKQDVKF